MSKEKRTIKSGPFKGYTIKPAPQDELKSCEKEMGQLLLEIGRFMSDDAEDWASSCFVTDMSTVSDFGLDEEEVSELSTKLGFLVRPSDSMVDVALKMKKH